MSTQFSLVEQRSPFAEKLELLSRLCAIGIAFALPISTTMTDILFVAAVALTILAGSWQEKLHIIIHTRIIFVFLLFFLMFVIGTVYSVAPHHQALDMASKYDKFLLGAFLTPLFVDVRWRRYAIYAFALAMIVTLILSYIKFMIGFSWKFDFGAASVFKDHIQTNFLMAFMAYLTAWFAVNKPRYRWFCVLLILALVINILFLSQGRSGYFVFVALMALLLWQTLRWRGLLYALIGSLILIIAAYSFSPSFKQRINEITSDMQLYHQGNPDSSVGRRMSYTHNSLKLVAQHPIIGTGTGSFAHDYANIKPTPAILTVNPHNEYLNITVQFGLIGLALLIFMFYVHAADSRKLPQDMRWLTQAVLLSIALGSFANSWLMDTTEGHFYTFFVALTFASLWQRDKSTTVFSKT